MNDTQPHPPIDTARPHPARRYNYWLGGKDNFAADRASGDRIAAAYPGVVIDARDNRAFLQRAVRYLTAEAGVRQFLDIGTGLPTADNTHEVAQRIAPESHVLYVDNDPLVMAHARALLTSSPEGMTDYLAADLREPEAILTSPLLRDTLDWTRPVAVLLVAVLHFIDSTDEAHRVVDRLTAAMPAGSYLLVSHSTDDLMDADTRRKVLDLAGKGKPDGAFRPRSLDEVARFFHGFTLLAPGVVSVTDWRPDDSGRPVGQVANMYGALGRKD